MDVPPAEDRDGHANGVPFKSRGFRRRLARNTHVGHEPTTDFESRAKTVGGPDALTDLDKIPWERVNTTIGAEADGSKTAKREVHPQRCRAAVRDFDEGPRFVQGPQRNTCQLLSRENLSNGNISFL
jgi:hypothetical protein